MLRYCQYKHSLTFSAHVIFVSTPQHYLHNKPLPIYTHSWNKSHHYITTLRFYLFILATKSNVIYQTHHHLYAHHKNSRPRNPYLDLKHISHRLSNIHRKRHRTSTKKSGFDISMGVCACTVGFSVAITTFVEVMCAVSIVTRVTCSRSQICWIVDSEF